MKIGWNIVTILGVILLTSCGSSKKDLRELEERKHEGIKRDYIVRDSSSNFRPGWIEDAEIWSKNHNLDMKKYRYFSYETEPKISRGTACDLAKANTKVDIAGEIATFIDKTFSESKEGKAGIDENNPNITALKEYMESTLAQKVQALIHGASVVKSYWEKRKFLKKMGAKRDYTGYTCAIFIRMNSGRLEDAIEKAANFVANKTDDPETKANVKKALKDVREGFKKAKKGEI